jgi:prepilin-type N-terminal cleavage/methylation domain-containing protein
MKNTGFTLIEVLIVVTIIAVLSAIILINYQEGQAHLALQRSTHILAQDIRRVQEMAMRAEDFQGTVARGGFGIRVESGTSTYILFADCNANQVFNATGTATNCNLATSVNPFPEQLEIRELEKNINIVSVSPNPSTIVFIPPDPGTRINAGVATSTTIRLEVIVGGITTHREVIINNVGLIEIK